jgi:hypothetical protein
MSEQSGQLPLHPSMSSPAAFPARGSRELASERDSVTPKPFCGERCSEPFASFDPATSSWRTSRISLFSDPWEDSPETSQERYSQTWPRSGSSDAGMCFQQHPSAPRTSVRGSSPLLPTPTASDGEKRGQRYGDGSLKLSGAVKLLPTPMARDGRPDGSQNRRSAASVAAGGGESVEQKLLKLLPTPHGMPKEGQKRRPGPSGNELGNAVGSLSTGESTSPQSDAGKQSTDAHLSPWFVEWMMGLPEGWSDPDCPLSATEFKSRWGYSSGNTSSNESESA